MNRLLALIQREYWENRIAFRATPIALFGIYMAGAIMTLLTFNHFDNEFHTLKEAVRFIAQSDVEIRSQVVYLANIGLRTKIKGQKDRQQAKDAEDHETSVKNRHRQTPSRVLLGIYAEGITKMVHEEEKGLIICRRMEADGSNRLSTDNAADERRLSLPAKLEFVNTSRRENSYVARWKTGSAFESKRSMVQ